MSIVGSGRVRLWLATAGGLGGLAGVLALAAGAASQPVPNDLPVGSCIMAYGNTGKIVDKVQGGYRMLNDGDASGVPVVVSASSAKPAACAGGAPALPPAAAMQGPTAGLKVGACATAYGQSGKIVAAVQGGYRIASDADPQGTPFVAAASSVHASTCQTPAAKPAGTPAKAQPQVAAAAPPQHDAAGCPGSSSPAGLAGRDKGFAGALLSNWTTPARPGSDGATTAKIQSLVMGPGRPANYMDQRQFGVPAGATMYPGRVKFTMCTDFRTEANYSYADENVTCYGNPADGSPTCSLAAHTTGLDSPRNWSVPK